jgi:hypothetical protein
MLLFKQTISITCHLPIVTLNIYWIWQPIKLVKHNYLSVFDPPMLAPHQFTTWGMLSLYPFVVCPLLKSDNMIAVMNRWLLDYESKLIVVTLKTFRLSFQKPSGREFKFSPSLKICCTSFCMLACLTHHCSVAILLLEFLVWPVCLMCLASVWSLTLVRNSALTLTWCANGWCFVK